MPSPLRNSFGISVAYPPEAMPKLLTEAMSSRVRWVSVIVLLFILTLFSPQSLAPAHASVVNSVLVIHSYPPNIWTEDISRGFTKALEPSRTKAQFYYFHSSYWQTRPKDLLDEETKRILEKVRSTKPAVLVLVDDEATETLAVPLANLSLPIVFTGINTLPEQVPWRSLLGKGAMTGVWEAYPVQRALEIMSSRLPKNKKFSILTSDTPTSKQTIAQFKTSGAEEYLAKKGFKLRETYLLSKWEEWKNALKEIDSKDDFYWVLIPFGVKDEDNRDVDTARMVVWMKENVKVPGVGARSLANGMLMSVGVSAEKLGAETGAYVEKLLQGAKLAELPPKASESYELVIRNEVKATIKASQGPRK